MLALVVATGLAAWIARLQPSATTTPASAPVQPGDEASAGHATEPPTESAPATATAAREPVERPQEPGETVPRADAPGILRARLIDADTGEPVGCYTVELGDLAGALVRATSDGDGRFASPTPLVPGRVRIDFVDFDGQPAPDDRGDGHTVVDHGEDGAPVELAVAVGPTYRVDVELPEGLAPSDLRASLHLDPPSIGYGSQNPSRGESRLRAPCASAVLPWVRFRESAGLTKRPWLELSTDDGLVSGGARAPAGPGVHPEPVRIELAPACAVRGRFVVRGDPTERGHAATTLVRLDAPELDPLWTHTDGDGRFRVAGLAPGRYRLEVRDEARRAEPIDFELRAGELDLGEREWTVLPVAGRVRLRVRSAVRIPIDVQLVRRFAPPRYAPWHSDSWEELPGGGFESPFEWDEIHAGDYEVVVHTHDLGDWHVSLGELVPPVEDLLLELPAPRPALELDVVDESGAPLADYTVLVRGERAWEELDGPVPSLRIAVWDDDTAFAVLAPGRRAHVVQPGTPGFAAPTGEPLRVRLEPGWSHLFLARERSRDAAVAGVEVRLDGVAAGRTDARGELWVHAAAPARALDVRHPSLAWDDASLEFGGLEDTVTWLVLHR